jgi:hypothetical protein
MVGDVLIVCSRAAVDTKRAGEFMAESADFAASSGAAQLARDRPPPCKSDPLAIASSPDNISPAKHN